jgi:hypothetical protein
MPACPLPTVLVARAVQQSQRSGDHMVDMVSQNSSPLNSMHLDPLSER